MLRKIATKDASAGTAGREDGTNGSAIHVLHKLEERGLHIRPHGDARVLDRGVDNRRVFTVCSGGPVVEYVQVFDGGYDKHQKC